MGGREILYVPRHQPKTSCLDISLRTAARSRNKSRVGKQRECYFLKRATGEWESTGPGEGGSCVSPLSDSGVIAGSPAPPELIRAIINKLNMKELVVSRGRGWGGGQARAGQEQIAGCVEESSLGLQGRPFGWPSF